MKLGVPLRPGRPVAARVVVHVQLVLPQGGLFRGDEITHVTGETTNNTAASGLLAVVARISDAFAAVNFISRLKTVVFVSIHRLLLDIGGSCRCSRVAFFSLLFFETVNFECSANCQELFNVLLLDLVESVLQSNLYLKVPSHDFFSLLQ